MAEGVTWAFEALRDANLSAARWIFDVEKGISNWAVGNTQFGNNRCGEIRWGAIEADPRFPALLEELLELGFQLPDQQPQTDVLLRTVGNYRDGGDNYLVWNALMKKKVSRYYNQSMWAPAASIFPDLKGSDYYGYYSTPQLAIPDLNGHQIHRSCSSFVCQ